jgi:hypothetical protein
MKRFFCILFVLVLLPVISFADPGVVLCYRMNHYAAAYNEDHPGYFDYDTMMVDLYMMDDFKTAYYMKTVWTDGKIDTTGFVHCTIQKSDGKYSLIFDDGSCFYFYYDDASNLWLEMNGGSFHLLECERFNIKTDFKSE